MPFQSRINRTLPVGVEGDFASTNPYHSLLNASGGQYKAGSAGVIVGRFAWVDDATGLAVNAKGSLTRGGFVKRANTATVLTPSQEYSLTIRGGFEVELFDGGDFFARFNEPLAFTAKPVASSTHAKRPTTTPAVAALY